jgi:hypothetical protein
MAAALLAPAYSSVLEEACLRRVIARVIVDVVAVREQQELL